MTRYTINPNVLIETFTAESALIADEQGEWVPFHEVERLYEQLDTAEQQLLLLREELKVSESMYRVVIAERDYERACADRRLAQDKVSAYEEYKYRNRQ